MNLLELHGSLFRVRCTKTGLETSNYDSPICEALAGKGLPDPKEKAARIPVKDLPRCKQSGELLRPAVVWFGEGLDSKILRDAAEVIDF